MPRVAVIMACHNRADQTLRSLRALFEQDVDVQLAAYLLDDASRDETATRVAAEFPSVTILEGDGSLFWNGGMRIAFAAAISRDYDYYLWLNDDTTLAPDALSVLLDTSAELRAAGHGPAIVAGSTRDPETGMVTYGGVVRSHPGRPLRMDLVAPGSRPQRVDTVHGNCVLIPHDVVERVGNLDPAYTHAMGDSDYGLRAGAAGCSVWIAPGTVAECAPNPLPGAGGRSLRGELRALVSVKQLPPRDWAVFARRWAGPLWPLYWASPYVRRTTRILSARLRPSRASARSGKVDGSGDGAGRSSGRKLGARR